MMTRLLKLRSILVAGLVLACILAPAGAPRVSSPASLVSPSSRICLAPLLDFSADLLVRMRAQELARLPFKPEIRNGRIVEPDLVANQMFMIMQLAGDPQTLAALFRAKIEECRAEILKHEARADADKPLTPEQVQLVRELIFVYAPLAERLGLTSQSESINDLCFMLSANDSWRHTLYAFEQTYGMTFRHTERMLARIAKRIEEACIKRGISAKVSYRQKKLYSIHEKTHRGNSKYTDVMSLKDVFGIRIMLDNLPVDEKSFILDLIDMLRSMLPVELLPDQLDRRTISEYGYNGWHIGFDFTSGLPSMEVQIMTEPDMQAYFDGVPRQGAGISAHWAYKVWKKSGEREVFRYVPGLETAGKRFPVAFKNLKDAADAAGTFVFVSRQAPALDSVRLVPGATPADAAYRAGWLTDRFRGLFVADWTNPQELRFVSEGDAIKPGEIIMGVQNSREPLSAAEMERLIALVEDPVARYDLFRMLRERQGVPVDTDEDFIGRGVSILEKHNVYVSESNFMTLEKIALKMGFLGLNDLACAAAVEARYGKKGLVGDFVREVCIEGMNILVTHYNINPVDDRIDDFLPGFPARLGESVSLSRREAFFFALALGQANTDYLDFAFDSIRSPITDIKNTERDVVLSLAA